MKTGIELIAQERARQVYGEGWTAAHDDVHAHGEMAGAAACYAMYDLRITCGWLKNGVAKVVRDLWPWAPHWWKPKGRIENLVRAGALIAAEIDRLQRKEAAVVDEKKKEQVAIEGGQ